MYQTDAPGCHRCGAPPLFQWVRLAAGVEIEQQKLQIGQLQGRRLDDEEIAQRYGPLRVAVTGCADHHLGMDTADPDSGLDLRALVHRSDCGGHYECRCAQ